MITRELLISKDWRKYEYPIFDDIYKYDEYQITVANHNATEWKGYWFISMRYDMSNTPKRDWCCHIDNNLHETVASVDIGTIDQFNKLMELMDIEYRLNN